MSLEDITFDFIRNRENSMSGSDFRDNKFYPYFDVSRWSIGFGTLAGAHDYTGISVQEAIRRSKAHIKGDIESLKNVLSPFRENQKVALLSYAYQHGPYGLTQSDFYKLAKQNKLTESWALSQPYSSRRLAEVKKFNEIVSSSQIKFALLFAGFFLFFFALKK